MASHEIAHVKERKLSSGRCLTTACCWCVYSGLYSLLYALRRWIVNSKWPGGGLQSLHVFKWAKESSFALAKCRQLPMSTHLRLYWHWCFDIKEELHEQTLYADCCLRGVFLTHPHITTLLSSLLAAEFKSSGVWTWNWPHLFDTFALAHLPNRPSFSLSHSPEVNGVKRAVQLNPPYCCYKYVGPVSVPPWRRWNKETTFTVNKGYPRLIQSMYVLLLIS